MSGFPGVPSSYLRVTGSNGGGQSGSMTGPSDEYYAASSPEVLADAVIRIVTETKNVMRGSGMYRRVRGNYNLFYSRDGSSNWEENLRSDGEGGGSIYLGVNVLKNAIDHLMQMVLSHQPAMDPVIVGSSEENNNVTEIAKAIIDYRLHQRKDIGIIDEAVYHCPVVGASYLHSFWNPFAGGRAPAGQGAVPGAGAIKRVLPDGTEIAPIMFKGDIEFEVVDVLSGFMDMSLQSWETGLQDMAIRSFRNKYNLATEYPELRDAILSAPPKNPTFQDEYLPSPTFAMTQMARTPSQEAQIEVWYYYHKRTAACPDGVMQIQLPTGTVLFNGPLPEWAKEFPVHRLAPDTMFGSTHGYAVTTGAGGIQESLNIGASAMVTNMSAFSRKLIAVQKGMDIDVTQIIGDLKLLEMEFGPNGTPPITSVDLLGNQQPLIEMLNWLVSQLEQTTGANAIVRGNPEGITAGVAINLYQSMALQFASTYEKCRSEALAWYATTVVRAYQAHPDLEREIRLIGKSKTAMLRKFYGNHLSMIDSFVVDPGNPAARTIAMRFNMLMAIKQEGTQVEPDKAINFMKTGDWDRAVGVPEALDAAIMAENEMLLRGELPPVIPGDDPVKHAQGHLAILANPAVRTNAALVMNVLKHFTAHAQSLAQGDIVLKMAAGMLPMGPFKPGEEQMAHGDTPAPSIGAQPMAPQGPGGGGKSKGPQDPTQPSASGPGQHPENPQVPPAPPTPGVPGLMR